MHHLFVYGSLKRGFSNHHFLEGQTFVGEAQTVNGYRMYDYGGFPAAVPVEREGVAIAGELWEIDDPCLIQVDWLEDVEQQLYARATARLAPPYDLLTDAIMYHYLRDVSSLPEVGSVWKASYEQPNPG